MSLVQVQAKDDWQIVEFKTSSQWCEEKIFEKNFFLNNHNLKNKHFILCDHAGWIIEGLSFEEKITEEKFLELASLSSWILCDNY